MKIDLKPCPYCGGIAKGHIKTVESFRKIHNYYVACMECGASTERYDTEFAYSINGKRFRPMTKEEAVEKAVYDWNNGIFDTQTRLLHMTEREKILWHTADLLKVAWYGANVLVGSLRWETAWELRKVAEEKKLLRLDSGKDYDMEVVADGLLHDDTVRYIVSSYLEEIRNNQEVSTNGIR